MSQLFKKNKFSSKCDKNVEILIMVWLDLVQMLKQHEKLFHINVVDFSLVNGYLNAKNAFLEKNRKVFQKCAQKILLLTI